MKEKILDENLTNEEWLSHLKNYYGEDETNSFCKYVINERKNNIRNILDSGSFSIFSQMENEQIAIINLFKSKKEIELDKEIKKCGYSFAKVKFYFESNNNVFLKSINFVCSEKSTEDEFVNNIINIAKKYGLQFVLITEKISNVKDKRIIKAKIYNTDTKDVAKEINNITIEEIERFLELNCGHSVYYKEPNNKKIIDVDGFKELIDLSYYSKSKQAKLRNISPYGINTVIFKMALLDKFSMKGYNK